MSENFQYPINQNSVKTGLKTPVGAIRLENCEYESDDITLRDNGPDDISQ